MFTSCIVGTVLLSLQTWTRYVQSPTVISIDKTRRGFLILYPSIYVCPTQKTDSDKTRKEAERLVAKNGGDVNRTIEYLNFVANLTYGNLDNITQFLGDKTLPQEGLYDIVNKIKFNFSFITVADKYYMSPYAYKTFVIMTEWGICCAKNSQVAPYLTLENRSHTYSENMIGGRRYKSTEFPLEVKTMNSDFTYFYMDPYEVPDILSHNYMGNKDNIYVYELGANIIYSTNTVRSLPIRLRKCRFFDEPLSNLFPMYSPNLCRMECRREIAYKLCGCLPYLYGVTGEIKECDVEGMACLAKNKGIFLDTSIELNQVVDCSHCYPLCDAHIYYTIRMENRIPDDPRWDNPGFQVKIVKPPDFRQKKDLLFSSTDLLESFGGTVNLFLGASILSMVEIFYYLTIHLFFYLRNYKRSSAEREAATKTKHSHQPTIYVREIMG